MGKIEKFKIKNHYVIIYNTIIKIVIIIKIKLT